MKTDTTLLDEIEALFRMRQNFDPMFYLSRRAYEGKHFVFWNRQSKQLQEMPMRKSIFNQLPEVAKQADSFENFLLATDLSFFIAPTKLSDDKAVQDSVNLSLLAEDYYNKLQESTVYADYIHYATLDNVSFIEVSANTETKDVEYRMFEAFDIIFNPLIKPWEDQRLVVKVVKKNRKEVMKSKLYNFEGDIASGDNNLYLGWKEIFEQEKYSTFARLSKDDILLLECHILDPEKGLRIKTLDISGHILRNDFYENIKVIPIIPLRIYSGSWYQPSFVFRLIPNNRALDIIANRMDDLFLRLAKGGWIKQEEENIDGGMNEETGQIINYSAKPPTQIEMPVVPGFFGTWFQSLLSLSERYGIQVADIPKGSNVRANAMINSIKGLTQEGNTAVINNLRNSVKQIMRITMMWLYEMWDTPHEVIYSDITNDSPKFISEKQHDIYKDQEKKLVFIPNEFKRFDVELDNGMGYSLDERKKQALELYGIKDEQGKPMVSSRVVKQLFKLGASGYIMEGEEAKMYQTKEFQDLLNSIGSMTPDQKKAFQIVLQMIAKNEGENPTANNQMQGGAGQGVGGQPPPPTAPGKKPMPRKQPVAPQQPMIGGGQPNATQ